MDKIEIAKNFPDCNPEELVEIQNYCAEMTAIQLVRFSGQYNEKRKNTSIAFWLNFFIGFLGAHRFYLEDWVNGCLYLVTLGLGGILPLIDLFRIKKMTADANLRIARKLYLEMLPEISMNAIKNNL